MKFHLLTISIVAASIHCASAFLNATPEQCEKAYGKVQFEKKDGSAVVRGYKAPIEGLGGAIVMASFYEGKVDYIQYEIKDQKDFTKDQFAMICMLNGESGDNPFNYAGTSRGGTKKLWSKQDSSAYISSDITKASLNVVTSAWLSRHAKDIGIQVPSGSTDKASKETSNEETPKYSAEWLKKGCVAMIVLRQDSSNLTKEQLNLAMQVSSWINGFFSGVNSSGFLGDENEPLFYPPKEWSDSYAVAPLILSFMDSHEEKVTSKMAAWRLMLAWYYRNHPKATAKNKAISDVILNDEQ